jgi:hypothetical protein
MKFRLTLGLLALVAGLVFGFTALPIQAHAASAVTLSANELSTMQSILDITKVQLDTIQLQINRNEIQDKQATLSNLGTIRAYLLNMRELLGGAPASSVLIEDPEPMIIAISTINPLEVPDEEPIATISQPVAEVAGSAVVNDDDTADQRTASVSSNSTPKRVFWIILITAVIIAIILAIPRREKDIVTIQDSPQQPPVPQPQATQSQTVHSQVTRVEETEVIQSA